MSGAEVGLALSVFLACTVEAVEALTIVLAVGTTRSWSSALSGVGAATLALAAIVAALGPALTSLPIDLLRVLVGGLLLIFGLQWLRKAILRSAGLKAKHDELEIFREESEAARAAGARRTGFDGYAFAISFKGVLVMLTSFGMFWGAEGAGASWPGGDAALLALIPGLLLAANVMVWALRHAVPPPGAGRAVPGDAVPADAADRVVPGDAPDRATVGA
jgi:uncharacterized membrane protein